MKKTALLILSVFLWIGTITIVHADRQCKNYSQQIYHELFNRVQHNDNNAMFLLSTVYCDDCAKSLDTCANDSIKWLKAAAQNGHADAKLYLQGKKDPSYSLNGDIFYLAQEIKSGDYIFRSYRDSETYAAYMEILKENKVIFAMPNNDDTEEFRGSLSKNSLIGDKFPTLEVWPNNGGHADSVNHLYFSLGNELTCLVAKKSNSIYWPLNRFEQEHSPTALVALQQGAGELKSCATLADNLFADQNKLPSTKSVSAATNQNESKADKYCDNANISKQKKAFQILYNEKRYADAYSVLHDIVTKCNSAISYPEQLLWLQNDLLITSVNLKQKKECLVLSKKIKNNPFISMIPNAFESKAEFNIKKCEAL